MTADTTDAPNAAGPPMVFVISSPRSGSTMLERMLESHSMILGGPEPHLITPLAHLGVWDKVDKAPYDHVLAAESQKLFVEKLPGGEADYWRACRAYCNEIYGAYLSTSDKKVVLDKTPAYALVLPFIQKVFPDAKYIVLTRHPLATFSSFANSFFDGDYQAAQDYNPLLNRYVPAIAKFLRQDEAPFIHVKYEDLVQDPEACMEKIYAHIGVPFEAETINYGSGTQEKREGLGDPIGVKQHDRPTTKHLDKWVEELRADNDKRILMEQIIASLDPEDLETYGYPLDALWAPLREAEGKPAKAPRAKLDRYRIQRKLIIALRGLAKRSATFRKLVQTTRLAADVILRE